MKLKVGEKAADFSLSDQKGKKHKLSDYQGSWVFLYFYPRDFTPGCTKEACGIRDNFAQFRKAKVQVLGVSTDAVASHKKFAQKYNLPFTLLADEDKEVVRLYGVWQKKNFLGREFFGIKRTSFLIDPEGKISKIYPNVKPTVHAEQVLEDLSQALSSP